MKTSKHIKRKHIKRKQVSTKKKRKYKKRGGSGDVLEFMINPNRFRDHQMNLELERKRRLNKQMFIDEILKELFPVRLDDTLQYSNNTEIDYKNDTIKDISEYIEKVYDDNERLNTSKLKRIDLKKYVLKELDLMLDYFHFIPVADELPLINKLPFAKSIPIANSIPFEPET
jgi:uncharacterized protein YggL (DUF469 family)